MSIVIIGDVSDPSSYHLGDEAMTEYAIDALRNRGVGPITVIAEDPEIARDRYGVNAIPRIGFRNMTRKEQDARLDQVSSYLEAGGDAPCSPDPMCKVVSCVREADALIIAGGGNISTSFRNHLCERLALARVAYKYSVPIIITSQTFGPVFAKEDKPLLHELFDYALMIGAREATSYALVRSYGISEDKIIHSVDDAAWLEPDVSDKEYILNLDVPKKFIIASLTYHRGSSYLSEEEYASRMAETFDLISKRNNMDILMVPHVGVFDPHKPSKDQLYNESVVKLSRSGRVRAMPMLTARQAIALTRMATLSISTRYHPTVFGPSNAVPSIAITTSYYSSVRMHGSLSNAGMGDLAVPYEIWTPELIQEISSDIINRYQEVSEYLESVFYRHRNQSNLMWDAFAEICMKGANFKPVESIVIPDAFDFDREWAEMVRTARRVSDLYLEKKIYAGWATNNLKKKIRYLEKNQAKNKMADKLSPLSKIGSLLSSVLRR